MSEGRLANIATGQPNVSSPSIDGQAITSFVDGAPLDMFYYFNLDTKQASPEVKKQLADIYRNVNPASVDELLPKIRVIENKLGVPTNGETRYSKVWNYLRIQSHINKLLVQQNSL